MMPPLATMLNERSDVVDKLFLVKGPTQSGDLEYQSKMQLGSKLKWMPTSINNT